MHGKNDFLNVVNNTKVAGVKIYVMITYQYGHKIMIIIITTKTKYKIKNKM